MKLFGMLKKMNETKELIKETAMTIAEQKNQNELLLVHDDFQDLIWVEDGIKKNFTLKDNENYTINIGDCKLTLNFNNYEPSLLNTSLPISRIINFNDVEPPSYYPSYAQLTNEQRAVYWEFLKNPYVSSINIGYVFILYYGLERHLLEGNFEKAFKVILKLRDVHSNHSFQHYSSNALVLSCLYHQRADFVKIFLDSVDKEYEKEIPVNLLLLCKYSFDIPLSAEEIMRSAKSFEFTNLNYIKKYPKLFDEELEKLISDKFKRNNINLKDIVTKADFKKLKSSEVKLFANYSIQENIEVPLLVDSFKLKKEINNLLEQTHNNVKEIIKVKRKNGESEPEKVQKEDKSIQLFDTNTEKKLLSVLHENRKNPVDRHFAYISLQDFYYKYRNISDSYLDKCIEFCLFRYKFIRSTK